MVTAYGQSAITQIRRAGPGVPWLGRILTDICSNFEFSDDSKILTPYFRQKYIFTINKSSVGKVGVHYYNDVRTGLRENIGRHTYSVVLNFFVERTDFTKSLIFSYL